MSVLRGFAFKKKQPGISRVLVLLFLFLFFFFLNREIFIIIRRPITQPSIAEGGREREEKKQVCLDCNGAVASPAFTSNDPTCFAGFDMAKQTLKNRKCCRVSHRPLPGHTHKGEIGHIFRTLVWEK